MTADPSSQPDSPQQWIRAHAGDAPEPLLRRVEDVLASAAVLPEATVVDALLRAGDILLASVIDEGTGEARAVALDLLAADACVTWAFEAASDSPRSLGSRAEAVMQRIAQVAR